MSDLMPGPNVKFIVVGHQFDEAKKNNKLVKTEQQKSLSV